MPLLPLYHKLGSPPRHPHAGSAFAQQFFSEGRIDIPLTATTLELREACDVLDLDPSAIDVESETAAAAYKALLDVDPRVTWSGSANLPVEPDEDAPRRKPRSISEALEARGLVERELAPEPEVQVGTVVEVEDEDEAEAEPTTKPAKKATKKTAKKSADY